MKNTGKRTGRLLITLGLLTITSVVMIRSSSAEDIGRFYKGRYACRISSDGTFEQAMILLLPNGINSQRIGHFGQGSTKTLMSDSFYCANNLPCRCVYSLDAGSSYEANVDGTGSAFMDWVASSNNDQLCPSSFSDDWSFVLSSDGSIQHIISDNNGSTNASGNGICNRTPGP